MPHGYGEFRVNGEVIYDGEIYHGKVENFSIADVLFLTIQGLKQYKLRFLFERTTFKR